MSRTYRRDLVYLDHNHQPMPIGENLFEFFNADKEYWVEPCCDHYSRWNVKADRKPWSKPSSSYKKVKKKARKAKIRAAMQNKDYNNVIDFPMEDRRDYT